MSIPNQTQILQLYKTLLRYGQNLKYTDKEYFFYRIKKEFKQNKILEDQDEIIFNYKGFNVAGKKGRSIMSRLLRVLQFPLRGKHTVDYTNVPKLVESDLEEQFVRGSGPGGQSVNKTSNCVVLKHKPTGIVVKCHTERSLEHNRKTAREILLTKVDNLINKENSIESQNNAVLEKKSNERLKRKAKLRALKEEWKKRENLK